MREVAGYELSTARSAGVDAEQLTELINAAMARGDGHILASTRTTTAEVREIMAVESTEFLVALVAPSTTSFHRTPTANPTSKPTATPAGGVVLAAVVRVDLPALPAPPGAALPATAATFGMVGTAKGHTRKGLAAMLIAEAESRSRAAGAATLEMHFPAVREDMFRYYGKLGYEHWRDTDMPERFAHLIAPHARPLRLRWMKKRLLP